MTTTTLVDRRVNTWNQMQDILARPKDPTTGVTTAENVAAYDTAEGVLDQLEAEIARELSNAARAEQYNQVNRAGAVAPAGGEDANPREQAYASAFGNWMRRGPSALTPAEHGALATGFSTIENAQGVGTGSAGGYTVPPAFRDIIIEQLLYFANMRQWAEVINTETGATLPWPTVNDTGNEGAILGENTADTELDVTFGQADLGAYMYTSKIVRASLQLLNDNAFGLERWLARALAARIARIQNRHFTVGTGTGQPDGIITSATVGKTGLVGQTTTVIYDDLVDMTDSIDISYVGTGNVGWMMSQTARKTVRKLKDSQQRPLWEPSLQVGTPDLLLGYPLKLNNYVPVPAASAKSIGFGDIREAYVIRDVQDFQLMQLRERYAEFLQVGFLGFQRSDGTMQNTSAFKVYQHPAT